MIVKCPFKRRVNVIHNIHEIHNYNVTLEFMKDQAAYGRLCIREIVCVCVCERENALCLCSLPYFVFLVSTYTHSVRVCVESLHRGKHMSGYILIPYHPVFSSSRWK